VNGVRATLAESGDEPLMLAEALGGAIVVVGSDRARAGVVAESLGATVHVLDDGFQHLRLARDLDIVMVGPRDLEDRVLPMGRLREPIDALASAHAVVVMDGSQNERMSTSMRLADVTDARVFSAWRHVSPPPPDLAGVPALLVSGIAGSGQLVASVAAGGWTIAGERAFPDHHLYSARDVAGIAESARAAGAAFVLTTAKDAVRLREVWPGSPPMHVAALTLAIDDVFGPWLCDAVTRARRDRTAAAHRRLEYGARHAS
jgi:tetraacyldisaccharide 4'-kinase